jgi:hypothetical protein
MATETEPRVVALCGPPGVGKTTVARLVADRLDAEVHRSDVVRSELVADGEPTYDDAETDRVYRALLDRAAESLRAGRPAVLDATFRRREHREAVASRFPDASFVRVTCAERVVADRLADRDDDASDADLEVYRDLRASFDPLERDAAVVDNSGPRRETAARVRALFG